MSAIAALVSSCLNQVSVTATMSSFFDVTSSEKGAVFNFIDRTFMVAILMLLVQVGPGFMLTSPASSSRMASFSDGREGGIGSNFLLKHMFKIGNLAVQEFDKIRFVMDVGWEKSV